MGSADHLTKELEAIIAQSGAPNLYHHFSNRVVLSGVQEIVVESETEAESQENIQSILRDLEEDVQKIFVPLPELLQDEFIENWNSRIESSDRCLTPIDRGPNALLT